MRLRFSDADHQVCQSIAIWLSQLCLLISLLLIEACSFISLRLIWNRSYFLSLDTGKEDSFQRTRCDLEDCPGEFIVELCFSLLTELK